MGKLTYDGVKPSLEYEVDHVAVDYTNRFVHGYSASGDLVVAFEGVDDFILFVFDGRTLEAIESDDEELLPPERCLQERCNDVKCFDGALVRPDGSPVYGVDSLWWNADTSSDLPAQSIQLRDISAYKEYIVNTKDFGQFRAKVGESISITGSVMSGTRANLRERSVILYELNGHGELALYNCYNWLGGDDTPSVVNSCLVIEAIYGVKGVL